MMASKTGEGRHAQGRGREGIWCPCQENPTSSFSTASPSQKKKTVLASGEKEKEGAGGSMRLKPRENLLEGPELPGSLPKKEGKKKKKRAPQNRCRSQGSFLRRGCCAGKKKKFLSIKTKVRRTKRRKKKRQELGGREPKTGNRNALSATTRQKVRGEREETNPRITSMKEKRNKT